MFHEFGHALHGMFSDVRYPRFAGTSVPRDFVEYPSQVNEMWATWPEVLRNYAKHYQTGRPDPAGAARQGDGRPEVQPGLLDHRARGRQRDRPGVAPAARRESCRMPTGVLAFEAKALADNGVDFAPVPPRYRSTYYSHIFAGGYSAGYYSYFWSEVLDATSVEWMKAHGGLTRENGDRFREDAALARGQRRRDDALPQLHRGRSVDRAVPGAPGARRADRQVMRLRALLILAALASAAAAQQPLPPGRARDLPAVLRARRAFEDRGADPLRRHPRSRRLPDRDEGRPRPDRRSHADIRFPDRDLDPQARLQARGDPRAADHPGAHRPRRHARALQEAFVCPGRCHVSRRRAREVGRKERLPVRGGRAISLRARRGRPRAEGRRRGRAGRREADRPPDARTHARHDDVDDDRRRRRPVLPRGVRRQHFGQPGHQARQVPVLSRHRRRLPALVPAPGIAEARHLPGCPRRGIRPGRQAPARGERRSQGVGRSRGAMRATSRRARKPSRRSWPRKARRLSSRARARARSCRACGPSRPRSGPAGCARSDRRRSRAARGRSRTRAARRPAARRAA